MTQRTLAPLGRWSASIFIMQSVTGLASLAFLVLTARFLGPGPRGIIALFGVTVLLWVTIGLLGIPQAILHFIGRGAGARVLLAGFRHLLVLGIVLALIGATTSFPLITHASFDWVWAGLVAVAILAAGATTVLQAAALGLGQFTLVTTMRLLSSATSIAALLVLHALDALTALVAAGVWTTMWVVNSALLAGGIRLPDGLPAGEETPTRARIMFALRSFPSSIGEHLGARLDQWLVGILTNTASAGIYSVALGLSDVVLLPSQALGSSLFAAASRSELHPSFPRRSFAAALGLSAAAAVGLAATAPWVIPFVFGDAFRSAIVPAMVIALATVAFGMQRSLGPYMAGLGRPGYYSLASITTAVVLAVGVVVLVPAFGLRGAAVGSAIAYVAGGAFALVAAIRIRPESGNLESTEGAAESSTP